ncbi:hypothetical protein [Dictyobacter kobayashii]|uniref:Uncharacterized protein n=1 Tax=Dictyobacter kobayashii TaxID=2014872 RepID=A0A402AI15_9CHLR|nr:hypothetical protein [Dictyobacter kobayashii]GCE18760.1 hypothetical protein KDK_25600 [Dictyobacter kobayashii]
MSQYTSSMDSTIPSALSVDEQRTLLRELRSEILERYRPHIKEGAGPIRVMARIVAELEQTCRQHNIADDIIHTEVVNRTIGDIDLRQAVECEGEEGGPPIIVFWLMSWGSLYLTNNYIIILPQVRPIVGYGNRC